MRDHLQSAIAIPGFAGSIPASTGNPEAAATTTIQFLSTEREWNAPRVQEAWRRLMATSTNPSVLFQTPEWFENKHLTKREELRVAVVTSGETITAIAPFLLGQKKFYLKLCRMRLSTAQLLGGEGLTQQQEVYEPLFEAIFKTFDVDAIHFRYLHMESPCWKAVQSSRAGFVHVHNQFNMYIVDLPQTFDEYLATRFDSKHRRNLKHRVKLLREQGKLRLQRIAAPEDVPEFLRFGGQVARASWQATEADWLVKETPEWSAHLNDLAKHGLLRSYLLWCGSQPCAYALGFQGGGCYYAYSIGYDPSMAKFSPGIVMLLLIIEDLIQHDHPGKFNFGGGENEYKRRFATDAAGMANVTMLQRSIMGGLRAAGFAAYQSLRDLRRRDKGLAGNARGPIAKGRRLGQTSGETQAAEHRGQRQRAAMLARHTGLDATRTPVLTTVREDGPR